MSTRWLISWYQWSFLKLFLLAELWLTYQTHLPTVLGKDFTSGADLQVVPRRLETDSLHCVTWLGLIALKLQLTTDLIVTQSIDYLSIIERLELHSVGRFHLAKGACCTFSAVSVMSQTFCSTGHIDFFSDINSNSQAMKTPKNYKALKSLATNVVSDLYRLH